MLGTVSVPPYELGGTAGARSGRGVVVVSCEQAANFRRDDGRITFSGSGVEWPLLAGSQDRLSWMIQLAAIAAAEPERLVDGGRITMVVVGARGDAGVWTLRYAGREDIATASGTVHAVKFVREGRSAYDTSAEIWLDPERSY